MSKRCERYVQFFLLRFKLLDSVLDLRYLLSQFLSTSKDIFFCISDDRFAAGHVTARPWSSDSWLMLILLSLDTWRSPAYFLSLPQEFRSIAFAFTNRVVSVSQSAVLGFLYFVFQDWSLLIWSSFALLISGPVGRFLFRLSIFVEIVDTAFFNFFLRRHSRQWSHDSIKPVFSVGRW